jgi:hypothetical protein
MWGVWGVGGSGNDIIHKWMGWMYCARLARQSKKRKAQYEAKAGGMNHEVCTFHTTDVDMTALTQPDEVSAG